jgi:PIN domain nuclease of toxin-antitoxin system
MHLLDTHVLLWARLDPAKLTKAHKAILQNTETKKVISSISIWEISLKFALGKLDLGGHSPEEFLQSAINIGLEVVSPEPSVFASYHRLSQIPEHRDPFDRMLIWQSIQSQMTLLSSDSKLSLYKPAGLLVE